MRAPQALVVLPVVAAWKKERGEKPAGRADADRAPPPRDGSARRRRLRRGFGFNGDSGSNTVALRERGWRGHLFDCCLGPDPKINLHKAWLSVATIAELFRSHGVPSDLTYLSVDIDASDIWLLRALLRGGFKPSLVTIEYNSNFPADAPLAFPDPDADPKDAYPVGWDGGCYMGSSFAAIEAVAREEGYVIVDVEPGYDLFLARADMWGARPVLRGAELERRAYAPFNLPPIVDGGARARWAPTSNCPRCRRAAARTPPRARRWRRTLGECAARGGRASRTRAARSEGSELLACAEGALPAPQCVALPRRRRTSPCDAYPPSAAQLLQDGLATIGPPCASPRPDRSWRRCANESVRSKD